MKTTPTNHDDIIDSRDIIARIEELEADREAAGDALEGEGDKPIAQAMREWDATEDGQELKILKALAEEAEGYSSDWKYGETLIRDSYFKDYAQELAEDTGDMDAEAVSRWPFTCIDWEQAARVLQMDYTCVDFDGVEYWIRSC